MTKKDRIWIGWWENIKLPELHTRSIKAKVDTGAKTSALHAEQIETFRKGGKKYVRFVLYPNQKNRINRKTLTCPMVDERIVKSSIGVTTKRPVIQTPIQLGDQTFDIELTLVNRDLLGFRMLLGRQAMRGHFWIDPSKKNLQQKKKKKKKPL